MRQLLFGNSAPFFTLVGVSLASGTGIITKEDELDGICWEIREAVARMQKSMSEFETELFEPGEDVGLDKFTVGPVIAKGSNAVVYAARKNDCAQEDDRQFDSGSPKFATGEPLTAFPLAVKMMFNYDTESNAMSILRSMHREIVPAQLHYSNPELSHWENGLSEQTVALPGHPNVVAMYCVFADHVPRMPGCLSLYPDALPARINPDGYGRNMSLFLIMKRYDTSLKEFLAGGHDGRPTPREAVLLLAQLLEAVCHINRHGVAHRDLKSDNILLEFLDGGCCPQLVVTDFGCCLADRRHGLTMPFRSWDTDRGGNAALMAPEVATAEPGLLSSIDYSKADVWAAGTLAYEMFSGYNPFYRRRRGSGADLPPLRNTTYTVDQLPDLTSAGVPETIRRLIRAMLARHPSNRPDAEMAATICQLYLWAPSGWLKRSPNEPLPSSGEILQWLLCLTTKVLCSNQQHRDTRRSAVEYQLIASLLTRARLGVIKRALHWIHRGGD
ncbi:hypothetical protein AAG570_004974 [Ranatra chinensis]|uniref:non-specific serine/threonine protein kinase n=1 Tax=Ranatra chinensis TaxID=642074 RepID=A0ABD0Y003_9HEMI